VSKLKSSDQVGTFCLSTKQAKIGQTVLDQKEIISDEFFFFFLLICHFMDSCSLYI
jgi:hypothetical protein